MDPVTHTLVGVGLANAFFKKRIGRPAVPILALASNLPDIDAAVLLTGDPAAILTRRTFGHSILLLPIWSLALSLLLRRFYPKIRRRVLFGLVLLGAFLHLFFDLINSFGVVLLWPLSDWRPELAMVFIIDPILTALLAAPILLALLPGLSIRRSAHSLSIRRSAHSLSIRRSAHSLSIRRSAHSLSMKSERLFRLFVGLTALYLLFCGWNRAMAERSLAAEEARLRTRPDFSYVFPEPLGPLRWKGVTREGKVYRIYLIHSWSGEVEGRGEIVTEIGDPRVERALETALGRRLELFFKAPVWRVEAGPGGEGPANRGAEVDVYDLRFRTLVIERRTPFVFHFRVEDHQKAEAER